MNQRPGPTSWWRLHGWAGPAHGCLPNRCYILELWEVSQTWQSLLSKSRGFNTMLVTISRPRFVHMEQKCSLASIVLAPSSCQNCMPECPNLAVDLRAFTLDEKATQREQIGSGWVHRLLVSPSAPAVVVHGCAAARNATGLDDLDQRD